MGIRDREGLRHSVGIETKGGRFTRLIPNAPARLADRDLHDG
jgi:hypothetical protein